MIVEPDFLTHWKTRTLVRLLDYEAAPLCVIALWAHCQSRKTDRLRNLGAFELASICGYPFTEAEKFMEAMKTSGFIELNDEEIIVHDFAQTNAKLFSNWTNGILGGRPPKTHKKPTKNPQKPNSKLEKPILSNLSYLSTLKEEGVRGRFEEWMVVRKGMGKAPKDWNKMFTEQCKWLSDFDPVDQMEIISASIRNNWQGLFEPRKSNNKNGSEPEPKSIFQQRDAKIQELNILKRDMMRQHGDAVYGMKEFEQIEKQLMSL